MTQDGRKRYSVTLEPGLYFAFLEALAKHGHDRSEVLEAAMRSYVEQGSPRVLLRLLARERAKGPAGGHRP